MEAQQGGASSLGTLVMTHISITEGNQQGALCIQTRSSPDMEKFDMGTENSLSKPLFPTEKHLPGACVLSLSLPNPVTYLFEHQNIWPGSFGETGTC